MRKIPETTMLKSALKHRKLVRNTENSSETQKTVLKTALRIEKSSETQKLNRKSDKHVE